MNKSKDEDKNFSNLSDSEKSEIVKLVQHLFILRADVYAKQREQDGKQSYNSVKQPLTEEVLSKHFKGEETIGTYQIELETGRVKWGVLDIDGEHVADAKAKTEKMRQRLVNAGVGCDNILMEGSGSPDSYHLWIFFEEPTVARKVKEFLERIAKPVDPEIEIFPKQEKISTDGFGNLVKLPFGFHKVAKKWGTCNIQTEEGQVFKGFDALKHVKPCKLPKSKKIKTDDLRPCFVKTIEERRQLEGAEGDFFRFALVNELIFNKVSDEQIHEIYKLQSDYDFESTQRKIDYSRQKYGEPFKCATISDKCHTLLTGMCDTCMRKPLDMKVKGKKEAKEGTKRRETKEEEKEFDYNEWKKGLAAPKPKMRMVDSVINYFDDIGISYLYTPSHTHSENLKIKPLISICTVIPVFCIAAVVNEPYAQPEGVSGTFSHEMYVDQGVEKFLKHDTWVQMEILLQRLLKSPQLLCKPVEEVKKILFNKCKYYLDFQNENYNKVLTCWILGTYVLPIFSYYPFLTFYGLRNTGKSTAIIFILMCAFNSGGNTIMSSKSGFFRNIAGSKGVIAIDHFEKVKRGSDYYNWISLALEGGWNRSSYVRISEPKGDSYIPVDYSVFAPYVIGTRTLVDTFEEKGIIIETEKTEDATFKERCDQMDNDLEFQTIRQLGLQFGLRYGKEVKKVYDNFDDLHDMDSRAYNLTKPLLSIAKIVFPNDYDEIKGLLTELMAKREDEREDREETLLLYLAHHKKITKISLSDLRDTMDQFYPEIHFNTVKGDMRKLKIDKKHSTKPIVYNLNREAIDKKIKNRGLEKKLQAWGGDEKNVCVCGASFIRTVDLHDHQKDCDIFQGKQAKEMAKGGDVR